MRQLPYTAKAGVGGTLLSPTQLHTSQLTTLYLESFSAVKPTYCDMGAGEQVGWAALPQHRLTPASEALALALNCQELVAQPKCWRPSCFGSMRFQGCSWSFMATGEKREEKCNCYQNPVVPGDINTGLGWHILYLRKPQDRLGLAY